ncbi:MAG: hypothetical protein JRD93_12315 [Deltaproteobacteria bacterium]|nr:hypothetical protein [Deltaproteobacteria bacterium]
MPRKARIDAPGALHHIICRGIERRRIFYDNADRDDFKRDELLPLAGLEFQKDIERKAFNAGGGRWEAPAQNLMDFLGKSSSSGLNKNSYKMGAVPADMKDIFPAFVIKELLAAFNKWKEENLYPIGEGSGYTGGITSSAADAIKAVEINVLQG